MQTPFELAALAKLRFRGQSPTMAVFVTDDWDFAGKVEGLGCLAIRVKPSEHHECDWSPLAGLHVILAQWRTSLASEARLGFALLGARPAVFETLRRCCWGDVIHDSRGEWSKNLDAQVKRCDLLLRLSLS